MNVNDFSYWSYEQTFSRVSLLGFSFPRTSFLTDEIMSNIVSQTGLFDSMAGAVIRRIRSFYGCRVGRLSTYKILRPGD